MMTIDKLYHFIAGLILSLIGGYFNPLYGLIIGISAGIGKEVYDYYDYGIKFGYGDLVLFDYNNNNNNQKLNFYEIKTIAILGDAVHRMGGERMGRHHAPDRG